MMTIVFSSIYCILIFHLVVYCCNCWSFNLLSFANRVASLIMIMVIHFPIFVFDLSSFRACFLVSFQFLSL